MTGVGWFLLGVCVVLSFINRRLVAIQREFRAAVDDFALARQLADEAAEHGPNWLQLLYDASSALNRGQAHRERAKRLSLGLSWLLELN